jgi:hypothetical protein
MQAAQPFPGCWNRSEAEKYEVVVRKEKGCIIDEQTGEGPGPGAGVGVGGEGPGPGLGVGVLGVGATGLTPVG